MDYILLFQEVSDIFSWDIPLVFKILSYIITVIIGGVGYKYFNRWLSHSEVQVTQQQKASNNLIGSMEQRLGALSKRISDLEDRREESYQRELKVTKMLAKAEQKVEMLEDKVEILERNHKVMETTIDKYYQKYGPLDEIK